MRLFLDLPAAEVVRVLRERRFANFETVGHEVDYFFQGDPAGGIELFHEGFRRDHAKPGEPLQRFTDPKARPLLRETRRNHSTIIHVRRWWEAERGLTGADVIGIIEASDQAGYTPMMFVFEPEPKP